MFHVDVAEVDQDIAMLHMLVASVLSGCYMFNERFEWSKQHKTVVAAGFFLINGWLITFFNILFDIANGDGLCCKCLFLYFKYYVSMLRCIDGASDGKFSHQTSEH